MRKQHKRASKSKAKAGRNKKGGGERQRADSPNTQLHTFARAKRHIHGVHLPLLKRHIVHLLVHVLPEDDHLVPVDDIPVARKEGREGGRD